MIGEKFSLHGQTFPFTNAETNESLPFLFFSFPFHEMIVKNIIIANAN